MAGLVVGCRDGGYRGEHWGRVGEEDGEAPLGSRAQFEIAGPARVRQTLASVPAPTHAMV